MNILTKEMRRSLKELDLGLKGELTITPDMEDLGTSLFFDQVPPSWTQRAYASLHGLSAWYADLLLRIKVSPTKRILLKFDARSLCLIGIGVMDIGLQFPANNLVEWVL